MESWLNFTPYLRCVVRRLHVSSFYNKSLSLSYFILHYIHAGRIGISKYKCNVSFFKRGGNRSTKRKVAWHITTRINNTWHQAKIEGGKKSGERSEPLSAKKKKILPFCSRLSLTGDQASLFLGHLIAGRLWTPARRLGSPRSPKICYLHFISFQD